MTSSLVLVIGALVVLILDSLFFFGVGTVSLTTELGLFTVGVACYVASRLPLP